MGMTKDFYRISREKLDSVTYDNPMDEMATEVLSPDKDAEKIALLLSEGNLGSSPYFELFHPSETFSPSNFPGNYRYHEEDEVSYILGMIDGWTETQLMEVYKSKGVNHNVFEHCSEDYLPEVIKNTLSLIEFLRSASEQEEVVVVVTDC